MLWQFCPIGEENTAWREGSGLGFYLFWGGVFPNQYRAFTVFFFFFLFFFSFFLKGEGWEEAEGGEKEP